MVNVALNASLASRTCPQVPDPPAWDGNVSEWRTLSVDSVAEYLNSEPPPPPDPFLGESAAIAAAASADVQLLSFTSHTLFNSVAPMIQRIPVRTLVLHFTNQTGAVKA